MYIYTGQAALICMYTNAAPKTSARQQTPTSAGKAQLRRFGDYFNFRQLQTGASDKPRRCLSALAVARGIQAPQLLLFLRVDHHRCVCSVHWLASSNIRLDWRNQRTLATCWEMGKKHLRVKRTTFVRLAEGTFGSSLTDRSSCRGN